MRELPVGAPREVFAVVDTHFPDEGALLTQSPKEAREMMEDGPGLVLVRYVPESALAAERKGDGPKFDPEAVLARMYENAPAVAEQIARYEEAGKPDAALMNMVWLGRDPVRDWPEDAAHENGQYCGTCTTCGHGFTGHKRRTTCKQCTVAPALAAETGRGEVVGSVPNLFDSVLDAAEEYGKQVSTYEQIGTRTEKEYTEIAQSALGDAINAHARAVADAAVAAERARVVALVGAAASDALKKNGIGGETDRLCRLLQNITAAAGEG